MLVERFGGDVLYSLLVRKSEKKNSGDKSDALRTSSTATVRQYSVEQVRVFKVCALLSTTPAEMCLTVVLMPTEWFGLNIGQACFVH